MIRDKNSNKIIVGRIIKPQGIKGEMKIYPLTDNISRFEKLKEIFLGEEDSPRAVRGLRISGGEIFMYIDGIINRTDAEEIRNVYISVDKEDAVKPESGRYYISDMIGCKIYGESGKYLGTVQDILQNGAADVYDVSLGGKSYMFPFVEGLMLEVDIPNRKITVSEKRFDEVACYED